MIRGLDPVSEALFGSTRRRVLGLLLGRPDESFFLREIARRTVSGLGAVQRELARLVGAGLVERTRRGKQVFFNANRGTPVFEELRALLAKTEGPSSLIARELEPFQQQGLIELAFIYGSMSAGRHTAHSDVDLMIVGTVTLKQLLPTLRRLQEPLGREVNASIHPRDEFVQKSGRPRGFLRRVLSGPKVMLIGSDDDLEDLDRESLAGRARDERGGDPGSRAPRARTQ